MNLLEVKDLTITDSKNGEVVVEKNNFILKKNSCLGIVGESGSGKSMTVKAILGLTNPWLKITGSALFYGQELVGLKGNTLRKIRGKRICMIPQDAMTSFDPLYTIGYQMIETFVENLGLSKEEAKNLAISSLEKMLIREPEQVILKYPHQISGGMLQRCMIAIALAMKPDIIIAEEVVEKFIRLRELTQTSLIFISHDLGVVQHLATEILVMKDGICVESGPAQKVFRNPENEYTKYLIDTRVHLTESFIQSMKKEEVM